MAVFPKKPYKVGGCTIAHTQTTGSTSYQGRVGPTTTSLGKPKLRRYVGATSLHLYHAPTREVSVSKRITSVPRVSGMRPTGLHRTSERTGAVIRVKLYIGILSQAQESGNPSTLAPIRNGTFIPSHEWRRDFPCRFVKS